MYVVAVLSVGRFRKGWIKATEISEANAEIPYERTCARIHNRHTSTQAPEETWTPSVSVAVSSACKHACRPAGTHVRMYARTRAWGIRTKLCASLGVQKWLMTRQVSDSRPTSPPQESHQMAMQSMQPMQLGGYAYAVPKQMVAPQMVSRPKRAHWLHQERVATLSDSSLGRLCW